MKTRCGFVFWVSLMVLAVPNAVESDSTEELFDRFNTQYESLVPPAGSSVHSDYKLTQISLGSKSTVEMLTRIMGQNNEMSEKYGQMSSKYDRILKQNDKIISLLADIKQEIAAAREAAQARAEPGNMPDDPNEANQIIE